MIGINVLTLSLNHSQLDRVWSHSDYASASTITNFVTTLYQSPEVHLNWMTLPKAIEIPKKILLPFNSIDVYQTNAPADVGPNANFQVTSQTFQLSSIPRRIMVWCERTMPTKTYLTTDTFAQPLQLQITFDNRSILLGTATTEDLFMESMSYGLQMNWLQWSQTTGGIVFLDVAKNLTLTKAEEAPGVSCNKSMQITATFKNINQTQTINFVMNVLVISDGIFSIEDGTSLPQNTPLTNRDVLSAVSKPVVGVYAPASSQDSIYGGTLSMKRMMKAASKANRFLRNTKAISRVGNAIGYSGHPAFRVASALGYGMPRRGGALIGGALISKSELGKRATENNNNNNNNDDYEVEEMQEEDY
jgi:hypothetical protein